MRSNQIIFLRIAWMKHYQGKTPEDIPVGGGKYIQDYKTGGEVFNFSSHRNQYYGYARVSKYGKVKLENIDPANHGDFIDNVTVVFFARDPYRGGEKVIGWYKKARVFRDIQFVRNAFGLNKKYYSVTSKSAQLIPIAFRNLELPSKAAGRSNLWYGNARFIKKVEDYIKNYNIKKAQANVQIKSKHAWQADVEKRKKVENSAMSEIEKYYYRLGFEDVKYVHKENLGWDMEAYYGKLKLLIEVKGLQGKLNTVELTANEYKQAKANKKHFRLCIVEQALTNKLKKVYEFKYTGKKGRWQTAEGNEMRTQEMTSARLYKN